MQMPPQTLVDDETPEQERTHKRTRCRNCGGHVSARFARVFGNNADELYRCLDCSTLRDLQRGAGSGKPQHAR